MTDTFGSEPHDQDNGSTTQGQENDAAGILPSEDEFSDVPDAAEEQKAASTRRSPILPIAAAVGGIFLLGTVAWWQFGGKSSIKEFGVEDTLALSSVPSVELSAQNDQMSAPSPDATQITPKTGQNEEPKEDDLVVPPPAPLAQTGVMQVTPGLPLPPANGPIATTVAPSNAPPVPMAPPAATTVPAAPAPVFTGTTSLSTPPTLPGAQPETPEQRINTLTDRIENMQRVIDHLSSTPGAGAPSTQELLARIDKLEQKLAARGHNAADTTAFISEPSKATPKHKTALKTTTKKAKSESSRPVSGLVLRAVSNGQAWISTGPDSADLKQVQVGDKLPGIGKVTEIKMNGDKWVVRGTKGILQ